MGRVPFLSEGEGLAAVVVVAVVALAVLIGLAYHCADACTGCAADDGSFEAAAEEGAENGSAACADESAFTGADAALVAAMIVVVAVVVVVVAAMAAVTHSVIEVGILISILGAGGYREEARSQHERGDEYSFSYLHHAGLDAGSVGCVRIYSRRDDFAEWNFFIFDIECNPSQIYLVSVRGLGYGWAFQI